MTDQERQLLMDDLFRRASAVYESADKAFQARDVNEFYRLQRLHTALADEYQEIKRRSSTPPA